MGYPVYGSSSSTVLGQLYYVIPNSTVITAPEESVLNEENYCKLTPQFRTPSHAFSLSQLGESCTRATRHATHLSVSNWLATHSAHVALTPSHALRCAELAKDIVLRLPWLHVQLERSPARCIVPALRLAEAESRG